MSNLNEIERKNLETNIQFSEEITGYQNAFKIKSIDYSEEKRCFIFNDNTYISPECMGMFVVSHNKFIIDKYKKYIKKLDLMDNEYKKSIIHIDNTHMSSDEALKLFNKICIKIQKHPRDVMSLFESLLMAFQKFTYAIVTSIDGSKIQYDPSMVVKFSIPKNRPLYQNGPIVYNFTIKKNKVSQK